jgi:hypothetical protein
MNAVLSPIQAAVAQQHDAWDQDYQRRRREAAARFCDAALNDPAQLGEIVADEASANREQWGLALHDLIKNNDQTLLRLMVQTALLDAASEATE